MVRGFCIPVMAADDRIEDTIARQRLDDEMRLGSADIERDDA